MEAFAILTYGFATLSSVLTIHVLILLSIERKKNKELKQLREENEKLKERITNFRRTFFNANYDI